MAVGRFPRHAAEITHVTRYRADSAMALHGSAWAYLLKRLRGREAIADILTRFLNGDVQEGIAQAPDISPGASPLRAERMAILPIIYDVEKTQHKFCSPVMIR